MNGMPTLKLAFLPKNFDAAATALALNLAPLFAPLLAPTTVTIVAALASSLVAYALCMIALPFLATFLKRHVALRRLGLPEPKQRSLCQLAVGAIAQYDVSSPNNYCRTLFMDWMRELGGNPPLILMRTLERHFVLVLDPDAATLALSRKMGLEKSMPAYEGLNLMFDEAGKRNVLTQETNTPEWKLVRKAVAPSFSQHELRSKFELAIRAPVEAAADALELYCDAVFAARASAAAGASAASASNDAITTSTSTATANAGASLDIEEFAASMTTDVITSFAFGVGTNTAERLAARLAGCSSSPRSSSSSSSSSSVPAPTIPGAEDIVDVVKGALHAAERYVFEPYRAWFPINRSWLVSGAKKKMARVRNCVAAIVDAAAEKAEKAGRKECKGGGGCSGGGGFSNCSETIFSRLRAVAPRVAALDPSGRDDAERVVRREAGQIYFAGADTSLLTLSFTLALVAAHPRVARLVEEELERAGLLATPASGGRPPRKVEFADLSKSSLPYLHAVWMESMRLFTAVAGGTGRIVGSEGLELTVPDWEVAAAAAAPRAMRTVRIPPGTGIWVPFYVLHRSKGLWGVDADEFKPERFLDPSAPFAGEGGGGGGGEAGGESSNGNGNGNNSSTSSSISDAPRRFMPFSFGERDCVGQGLARTALMAELAVLLGRFSFAVDRARMGRSLLAGGGGAEGGGGLGSTAIAREAIILTLQVQGGLWLEVTPRAWKHREAGTAAEE